LVLDTGDVPVYRDYGRGDEVGGSVWLVNDMMNTISDVRLYLESKATEVSKMMETPDELSAYRALGTLQAVVAIAAESIAYIESETKGSRLGKEKERGTGAGS
jgi:hypothetical protein